MEIIDDQSSGANLTAAQDLVQNRDVFAVVNNSSFAFLAYRYMLGQGVPMIGGGFDGTYYTQKGNEDIISALGSGTPFPGLSYTTTPKVMKQLGAKKDGGVGYGGRPSSTASAKTLQDYASPRSGLDPVYTNTTRRVRHDRRRPAGARHQELRGRRGVPAHRSPTRTSRSCRA